MRLIDADAIEYHDDGAVYDYEIGMIPAVEAAQWIPCSERLPEDGERVIVQMINGYIGIIDFSAVGATKHLVAWMPLPSVYCGE